MTNGRGVGRVLIRSGLAVAAAERVAITPGVAAARNDKVIGAALAAAEISLRDGPGGRVADMLHESGRPRESHGAALSPRGSRSNGCRSPAPSAARSARGEPAPGRWLARANGRTPPAPQKTRPPPPPP